MYKLAALFIASALIFSLIVTLGWHTITSVIPAGTVIGLCLMLAVIYVPAMVSVLIWQDRQDKATSRPSAGIVARASADVVGRELITTR